MKKLATLAFAAAALCAAVPASAQFAKPEDAIKYRQSALFVMGQHFSRIGAMANGKAPFDAKAAAEDADIVADMAKLPWAGFGAGTEGARPSLKSGKSRPSSRNTATNFRQKRSSWRQPRRPATSTP